ncbi:MULTISPECIES: NAD(P)-binding protein [unclassified Bradyrhizobium]|uniref:NAD(P)-binding protein n=1 Tax=unclassified Bradyrhizobium TaxID=2631580 RepID=UPI002916428F|nr:MULTISPECIES: NAD(P)-binding protein [unclassified Bradyrhizobium]
MIAKQIVEAASVPRRPGLYCLGPFPRRVSFSAQQYRALNLVWALHEENRLKEDSEVAVIGAGLAGLTAAAAFAGYGCKVDLYDQTSATMSKQRHTYHRMVHPSVNQWPERELSFTTELPFLEWYAGACSDIVQTVTDEFAKLPQVTFFSNHEATDVVTVATDRLGLYLEPARTPRPSYDLVMLTIGFGEEGGGAFPPIDYWTADSLESLREKGGIHFIVSGCGDGGLIDALRLVHTNLRRGRLIFETAAALSGTPIAEAIKGAERKVEVTLDLNTLKTTYEQCAALLDEDSRYADIAKSLSASYVQKATLVFLLDRRHERPYSLRAAPIHKLMVAHALRAGMITYYQGEVTDQGGKIVAGGRTFDPHKCQVIVRHGASAKFGRLLGEDEILELKNKQKALADHYATKLWTDPYPVPRDYPAHDTRSKKFAEHRRKWAVRAVRQISPDANVALTPDGYEVSFAPPIPADAPDRLFGVSVKSIITPQIEVS